MSLNLRPLNPEEVDAREAGLDMAAHLVGVSRPLTIDDVQSLYDACLDQSDLPMKALWALGFSFGEQIVIATNFEWVRVSDEYGDETCVAPPGREIFCAPISMIKTRIHEKERLSVSELRDDTIATILTRIKEGKAADRN
jgi:hypothetical protein